MRAVRDYGCVLVKNDGDWDQVMSWGWRAVDRFQIDSRGRTDRIW